MSEWVALAAVIVGGLLPPALPATWHKVGVTYLGGLLAAASFLLGGLPHSFFTVAVLVFCFTRLVSSFWARSPLGAFHHRPRRATGGAMTIASGFVALAVNSLSASHQIWISYGIVAVAYYVCVVTVCQIHFEWARHLGWWDKRIAFSGGRPWGTMGNPMLTGTLFALTIPFTLKFLGWPGLGLIPGLVILGSRAAMFGTLVSTLLVSPEMAGAGLLFALVGIYVWRDRILKSFWRPESGLGRVYTYGWCVEQWLRRPFFGWGENSINAPTPGAENIDTATDFAHNGILDQLVHGGIVGTIAWSLVILSAITSGASLPAVVGYILAVQFVWHVPGPEQLFWVVLGLWR